MGGNYNGDGVKVDSFIEIPDGEYVLRITNAVQGVTAKGDDKVTVDYEIAEGPLKLETIKFHKVVFFKDRASKGAGMALKFLKSIGEPWEGQFSWNEKNWIGKKLKARVEQRPATQGKHMGKNFPNIAWVDGIDGANKEDDTQVPF